MAESTGCGCSVPATSTLIFACSGAADVGQIADLAARRLSAEGVGKMFCLAGVGGRVNGIMETTASTAAILAIDGYPLDCARKTLESAGFHAIRASAPRGTGDGEGKDASDGGQWSLRLPPQAGIAWKADGRGRAHEAKGIIRAVLLLFVGYSLVVLVAKHTTRGSNAATPENSSAAEPSAAMAAPSGPRLAANRIVITYFHGKERCENCRNLEAWAKETVETALADRFKAGQIEWRVVDFSQPQDAHYDQDYKLGGVSCVVLSEVRDGVAERWKVLDEGLMLAVTGTKAQVAQYVEREIRRLYQQVIPHRRSSRR